MIFMNAKDGLDCDALDNFQQLSRVGSTGDVKFLVELGRPKQPAACSGLPNWSGTQRFLVARGLNAIPQPHGVNNPGNIDMGSAAHLQEFVKWGLEHYPAQHYAVIIWGHGHGFRLQEEALRLARIEHRDTKAVPFSPGPDAGGVKYGPSDPETHSVLYNRAVADRLESLFPASKLDILGYDACLMGGIETAYAMRRFARIFVASEEDEPDTGWNYAAWASQLVQRPDLDPGELAKFIVKSYGQEYSTTAFVTLSAINLEAIGELSEHLSLFSREVAAQPDSALNDAIGTARGDLNYGGNILHNPVDLMWFLRHLEMAQSLPASARGEIVRLRDLWRRVVIENYASAGGHARRGSYGLSIYFPKVKADFDGDIVDDSGYDRSICGQPKRFPVEFVCCENWVDFLTSYLGLPSKAVSCSR